MDAPDTVYMHMIQYGCVVNAGSVADTGEKSDVQQEVDAHPP